MSDDDDNDDVDDDDDENDYNILPSLSIEHSVLCKLIRPGVLLHLAAPKMADKYFYLIEYYKNDVKMREIPLHRK